MKKKIFLFILSLIFAIPLMSNIVYCEKNNINVESKTYHGPIIENLKGKKELFDNLENLKRIRNNLCSIRICGDVSKKQLESINNDLDFYLTQLNTVKSDLEKHKNIYKDSFSDVYFAEQVIFITDSYILSIRQQQNLITQLNTNNIDAKKMFHSDYLIPIYYYLTLGDEIIAYIEKYAIISEKK